MKKVTFGLAVVFLFFSCDFEYHTQTVANKSSKTISYTMFHENGTFQLNPGQSRNHKVPHNSHLQPLTFYVSEMPFDVEMNRISSLAYEFADMTPINLHIANSLPVDVTISTGTIQYMSVPSITIPADLTGTADIFTKNPKFINETKHPVVINWNFDSGTNSIYVILR